MTACEQQACAVRKLHVREVAGLMLPYYKDKPQTLNRYPNGINGKTFYQKDVKGKVPAWAPMFKGPATGPRF